MSPMNNRLLRPTSGVHPEAAAWRSAVVAEGGSVSGSTLNAVSTFCAAIDAAGIRDKFYRLNLFCGDSDASLVAVRVPLYRGPSLGGTQYGNALDTNNNFVQGDYAETGASGGLIGNGSSKYLGTGIQTDSTPTVETFHLSFWTRGGSITATNRVMGSLATSPSTQRFFIDRRLIVGGNDQGVIGGTIAAGIADPTSDDASAGHFLMTRTAPTSLTGYKNALPGIVAASSVTPVGTAMPITVFAGNNVGSVSDYYEHRLAAYSIGDGLTGAQVTAYYNALNTFMGALSRT